MSYQRHSSPFPNTTSTLIPTQINSRNKENVPLNSQMFQKLYNISNLANNTQDNSFSHYQDVPNKLKYKSSNEPCIPFIMDEYSQSIHRKRENNLKKPSCRRSLGGYDREIDGLREIEKDMENTNREVREEKDILLNEFKSLGEKLRRMRDMEKKPQTRRYSLSKAEKIADNSRKSDSDDNSEVFHKEILLKLDDLNQKYMKLSKNMSSYQQSTSDERSSFNPRSSVTDNDCNNLKRAQSDQLYKTEWVFNPRKSSQEQSTQDSEFQRSENYEKEKHDAKDLVRQTREEIMKENEEFARRRKEEEIDLKIQREELENKRKHLTEFEIELIKKEKELNMRAKELDERTKKLEKNEQEFEDITEKLEKQSEELANQKMEYNKKIDELHTKMNKFEKEKDEYLIYEKEFNSKNIELRTEQEKLRKLREDLREEQKMIEVRCRDLMNEYDEFNQKKRILDEREQRILIIEEDLDNRAHKLNEEVETLNFEREEFIKLVDLAERRLREREQDLNEREEFLNLRKEKYDDFDLKLMGMKLNEEVWQKKRDIEVGKLQAEIKKIREKEKELRKREEKIRKIEGDIINQQFDDVKDKKDVGDTSTSMRTGSQAENSLMDKSLLPLSSRTNKTEPAIKEVTEN